MCGIVGIVPKSPADVDQLRKITRRMTQAIAHRGPDAEEFFISPQVALGVRQLKIIDVAGSLQPMQSWDGNRVIIFNGEIYNFQDLREQLTQEGRRFRTKGDTEVVLQAFDHWGPEGIDRLEGMFAFAIWDKAEKKLTLARDWLGQKSIYFAETDLGWTFASEIKGLLASGLLTPKIDLETLSHYMSLRYLPHQATLFLGISKVPPAHLVEVAPKGCRLQRLWEPRYEPKHSRSETELFDELDHLLEKVVAQHLMSEVPLGAFLSGGIDSSSIVAYAASALHEPLRTFSVGADEGSLSELPWARQVVERYRTLHVERIVEPDLALLTPKMVAAMDEPVDPFAAGIYAVAQVASEHVTVALGGDGGDELFAGYDRYVGQKLAQAYSVVPSALRRKLLRPLLRLVPESFGYKSAATKLRWLDSMADKSGVARYAESVAFLRFPHTMKSELFTKETWRDISRGASERLLAEYFDDGAASEYLDRMLHADVMTRLAEHQLPSVDHMSMAFSLEARNPFLDRRVAEFAMRIPASWKIRKRRIKYVLRKLGERHLPRELLTREKRGFGFPIALWLRGELRPLIERVARESRLAEVGIFRRDGLKQLVAEHVDGKLDHNYRLWMLFNLEVWFRHYFDGESVETLEAGIAGSRPEVSSSTHPELARV
jgi:asparagine synthase (glutamine-hydrolysing)